MCSQEDLTGEDRPRKPYGHRLSRTGLSEGKPQSSRWRGCPRGPREEWAQGRAKGRCGSGRERHSGMPGRQGGMGVGCFKKSTSKQLARNRNNA